MTCKQLRSLKGVYSRSTGAGGSRGGPSSVTLTQHKRQLIPLIKCSSCEIDILSKRQTIGRNPARSWEASTHCDKEEIQAGDRASCPGRMSDSLGSNGREILSCFTEKIIRPFFSQDSTKYSSFCPESHTPVYCGLPLSDLSRRERGDTLHTIVNINSAARDKTLPLKIAPRESEPFPSYSSCAKRKTVDTVRVWLSDGTL